MSQKSVAGFDGGWGSVRYADDFVILLGVRELAPAFAFGLYHQRQLAAAFAYNADGLL